MNPTFRGISLRQVSEDDMPFLFRLFADPTRCHLWMNNRRVYDECGFLQAWNAWTADAMGAKFLVTSAGRPLGLVFDYQRAIEDGHTHVTALLEAGSTGHGTGVVATALLVDWLFQCLPLRKAYMEVYSYNVAVLRMLGKLGIPTEGVLKENRFWAGAWWDLHIFALDRASGRDLCSRLLRRPEVQAGLSRPGSVHEREEVNPGHPRISLEVCC